jgi:dTMP kinase
MMKIIAITGTDGTGKSTLCSNLCVKYPNFREVSIWDAMNGSLFHTKKDIDTYLCSLSPNARLLFLSHALMQAFDIAQKSEVQVLLLNGYYYKYFASELALGADQSLVNKMMATFPVPDLIIELVGTPEVSFARKEKLSRYECGLENPSFAAFQAFQKKVIAEFQAFDRSDWKTISSELPIDRVFKECLKLIAP